MLTKKTLKDRIHECDASKCFGGVGKAVRETLSTKGLRVPGRRVLHALLSANANAGGVPSPSPFIAKKMEVLCVSVCVLGGEGLPPPLKKTSGNPC